MDKLQFLIFITHNISKVTQNYNLIFIPTNSKNVWVKSVSLHVEHSDQHGIIKCVRFLNHPVRFDLIRFLIWLLTRCFSLLCREEPEVAVLSELCCADCRWSVCRLRRRNTSASRRQTDGRMSWSTQYDWRALHRPASTLYKHQHRIYPVLRDPLADLGFFLEAVTSGTRAIEASEHWGGSRLTGEWNLCVCELRRTHNNNMK